ncbi:MAG: hypothetical protein Q4P06_09325 [Actinomycetaceae bacterium]|nr:hypothetical protein [Actinomycetaceae bacterium]
MGIISEIKHLPGTVVRGTLSAGSAVKALMKAGSITEAVDVMIDVPNESILERVNELRIKHPDASPAQLAAIVTKDFRRLAANTSGLAGTAAAAPGLGTVAGLGLSSAQLVGFVAQAGYYVLTMASIYGIPTDDIDKRRLLVLSSLMGEQGAEIASSQFGFSTLTALKGYASDMQRQTIKRVNRTLAKQASKQAAGKGLTATAGRLMPFGIGAALGWMIGRSMASNVVEGVTYALGDAPAEFAFPVEVECDVVDHQQAAPQASGLGSGLVSGAPPHTASSHAPPHTACRGTLGHMRNEAACVFKIGATHLALEVCFDRFAD